MIELRRLGADDWELLREVRLRSLADSPESFGSTYSRELAYDETRWRELIGDNGWFVAIDGEDAVGIACGYAEPSAPPDQRHLVAMWVSPATRGSGLAVRLIDAVVDWSRADGASEVTLGVAEANDRARAAYLKYGFEVTDLTLVLHSDPTRTITIYRLGI